MIMWILTEPPDLDLHCFVMRVKTFEKATVISKIFTRVFFLRYFASCENKIIVEWQNHHLLMW